MRSRQPKQLLLAFFGEYVVDQDVPAAAGERAHRGARGRGHRRARPRGRRSIAWCSAACSSRERRGREILFSLTSDGGAVLREATERVRGPHPFDPHGEGWTLVTFTRPRGAAHAAPPPPLRPDLGGVRAAARRAVARPRRSRPCCGAGAAARGSARGRHHRLPCARAAGLSRWPTACARAWDIDAHPREHLAFIETWCDPATDAEAGSRARCAHHARRRLAGAARRRPPPAEGVHGRGLARRPRSFEIYWRVRRSWKRRRRAVHGFDFRHGSPPRVMTCARASAPEARPQIGLSHFPRRRPRQLVDDDDVLRDLVAGDLAVQVRTHRSSSVDGCRLAHRDDGPGHLAPRARPARRSPRPRSRRRCR